LASSECRLPVKRRFASMLPLRYLVIHLLCYGCYTCTAVWGFGGKLALKTNPAQIAGLPNRTLFFGVTRVTARRKLKFWCNNCRNLLHSIGVTLPHWR
jgi:hypothetical protein